LKLFITYITTLSLLVAHIPLTTTADDKALETNIIEINTSLNILSNIIRAMQTALADQGMTFEYSADKFNGNKTITIQSASGAPPLVINIAMSTFGGPSQMTLGNKSFELKRHYDDLVREIESGRKNSDALEKVVYRKMDVLTTLIANGINEHFSEKNQPLNENIKQIQSDIKQAEAKVDLQMGTSLYDKPQNILRTMNMGGISILTALTVWLVMTGELGYAGYHAVIPTILSAVITGGLGLIIFAKDFFKQFRAKVLESLRTDFQRSENIFEELNLLTRKRDNNINEQKQTLDNIQDIKEAFNMGLYAEDRARVVDQLNIQVNILRTLLLPLYQEQFSRPQSEIRLVEYKNRFGLIDSIRVISNHGPLSESALFEIKLNYKTGANLIPQLDSIETLNLKTGEVLARENLSTELNRVQGLVLTERSESGKSLIQLLSDTKMDGYTKDAFLGPSKYDGLIALRKHLDKHIKESISEYSKNREVIGALGEKLSHLVQPIYDKVNPNSAPRGQVVKAILIFGVVGLSEVIVESTLGPFQGLSELAIDLPKWIAFLYLAHKIDKTKNSRESRFLRTHFEKIEQIFTPHRIRMCKGLFQ